MTKTQEGKLSIVHILYRWINCFSSYVWVSSQMHSECSDCGQHTQVFSTILHQHCMTKERCAKWECIVMLRHLYHGVRWIIKYIFLVV